MTAPVVVTPGAVVPGPPGAVVVVLSPDGAEQVAAARARTATAIRTRRMAPPGGLVHSMTVWEGPGVPGIAPSPAAAGEGWGEGASARARAPVIAGFPHPPLRPSAASPRRRRAENPGSLDRLSSPLVDWILVTNDDGVEVPSLPALARAIATLGPVRVVAPDGERSWVGKAITRFGPVRVEAVERGASRCTR